MTKEKLEYHRVYNITLYYKLRNMAIKYLGGKCAKCGTTAKLQFDHIDYRKKSYCVGKILNISRANFREELKKCQLLCNACHIEKTILERGKKIAVGTHGTVSSYKYCHCTECRKAKNAWTIEYRNRLRQKEYHTVGRIEALEKELFAARRGRAKTPHIADEAKKMVLSQGDKLLASSILDGDRAL